MPLLSSCVVWLTIFLMHALNLENVLAFVDDIIVGLVPCRQCRQLGPRETSPGERVEVETIDGKGH